MWFFIALLIVSCMQTNFDFDYPQCSHSLVKYWHFLSISHHCFASKVQPNILLHDVRCYLKILLHPHKTILLLLCIYNSCCSRSRIYTQRCHTVSKASVIINDRFFFFTLFRLHFPRQQVLKHTQNYSHFMLLPIYEYYTAHRRAEFIITDILSA